MTSWNDVINQITIPCQPHAIHMLAEGWGSLLSDVYQTRSYLDTDKSQLSEWHGDAADAYRAQLNDILDIFGKIHVENSDIPTTLHAAAKLMDDTIVKIPIPIELVPMVEDARKAYDTQLGKMTASLNGVQLPGNIGDMVYNAAASKYNPYALASELLPSSVNNFFSGLRDWISDQDDEAVKQYNALNTNVDPSVRAMPESNFDKSAFSGSNTVPDLDGSDLGGPGPLPDMPGGPGPLPDLADLNNDHNFDTGATINPDPTDYTSLAGAGGGGFSPYGGGGGGLGGVGDGAFTGLGGSGLTPGPVKGLGNLASFGAGGMPMMPMMPGAGGGQSGRQPRTGMVGGPGAGAHGNPGDERSSWLEEDDDVWGTDSGAAPPLLT